MNQAGDNVRSQVLETRVRPGRVIDVDLMCSDDVSLAFAAEGENGNVRAVDILNQTRLGFDRINLIATSDEGVLWRPDSNIDAINIAENRVEQWTLIGERTYAFRSALANEVADEPIRAELLSPLDGGEIAVAPGERYHFSALVGAHRCSVALVAMVEDAAGTVLIRESDEPDAPLRGGTDEDDFTPLSIDVNIPLKGARLRLFVRKGATSITAGKAESVVFVARPVLTQIDREHNATAATLTLERARLTQVAAGGLTLVRSTLRLAEAPPMARAFRPRLLITAGEETLAIDCFLPPDTAIATIEHLSIDHRYVTLRAQMNDVSTGIQPVGIFVDGELSESVDAPVNEGQLAFTGSISDTHLDGMAHLIELRTLPDQQMIAFDHAILPFRITPWEALQSHAGAPLDIAASPLAAHHYRNYRAWMDALSRGEIATVPDLGQLQDELTGGFRKRATYPPLAFPIHASPDVSIVIPLHNKFEITYNCLCSLLFAYNRATFEVILVDDGSTDATETLEEVVSGVTVVRHERAVGFVGSCNDGAAQARGEYVAFLNNDTEVTVGWLDELVETFANFDEVGLVGSKLVYGDGRLQEAGGIVWGSGNPWNVGRRANAAEPRYNYVRQVDYLSGAAILLPRSLWKEVGGFSAELAPAYFEDTDLAMKVRDAGRRVLYVPTSTVVHYEGQSAGTSTASGMKRFQEVNRPKFKRKWARLYKHHGKEGVEPDQEKDRGIAFRVLFIDHRFPFVDADAGSYAAWQEIRMLQAMGAKVTFLPRNLAWMDRHTVALQRAGVECLFAPFVLNFASFLEANAKDFDVVYVNRFRIAEQVVDAVRSAAPAAKIVLNLADLHFLRELREAAAGTAAYSFDNAAQTRATELSMVRACDLTLTYSDVEQAVLQSHMSAPAKIARVPWVVDTTLPQRKAFDETCDLLFLGGFGHPPNAEAVKFFVSEVMPGLRVSMPGVKFRVVGSNVTPEVLALASEDVIIEGYVADLDDVFASARVFVVPLLAGAGIKGKVLEAMARGATIVLSSVAAEATGLSHNHDCLMPTRPSEWIEAIERAYTDEELWTRLGTNARDLATRRFSFEAGLAAMRDALATIDIFGNDGLSYRHARPSRYGYQP